MEALHDTPTTGETPGWRHPRRRAEVVFFPVAPPLRGRETTLWIAWQVLTEAVPAMAGGGLDMAGLYLEEPGLPRSGTKHARKQ
jgi:hypothetical protein